MIIYCCNCIVGEELAFVLFLYLSFRGLCFLCYFLGILSVFADVEDGKGCFRWGENCGILSGVFYHVYFAFLNVSYPILIFFLFSLVCLWSNDVGILLTFFWTPGRRKFTAWIPVIVKTLVYDPFPSSPKVNCSESS